MESNSSCIGGGVESDSSYSPLENAEFEENSPSNGVQVTADNNETHQPYGNASTEGPIGSGDTISGHVLEVAPGGNIISALSGFYRRLQVRGLFLLSATGTVADVTIWRAGSESYFPGTFSIISLSGCILAEQFSLFIAIASPQMEFIFGNVEGVLRASGPVSVMVASYPNLSFHRFSFSTSYEEDNVNTIADTDANPAASASSVAGL